MHSDGIKPPNTTCPEIATNHSNATGYTFKINVFNLIVPLFTLERISQARARGCLSNPRLVLVVLLCHHFHDEIPFPFTR